MLLESDMFSDALTASTSKEPRKKKRRSSSSTNTNASTATSEESPKQPAKGELSPVREAREAKPLKFYRDTLDDADTDDSKSKCPVSCTVTLPSYHLAHLQYLHPSLLLLFSK